MKVIFNVDDIILFNEFSKYIKGSESQAINTRTESTLFECIERNEGDAYVLSDFFTYSQKAIDFIKRSNPYIPIIFISTVYSSNNFPKNVDIIIHNFAIDDYTQFCKSIEYNINTYIRNFEVLKKLTAKMHDKVEFSTCVYDPIRRILYHKNKEVKKLSSKEGGILEILASNYGQVVKKEVILEKVWRKTDYFAGRSMDVYITYLRNTLKNNKIKLTIKNISGVGLILE